MEDIQIKISVLIPVYNTFSYLKRCLDSVCSQDYDNFEVICVNDGSTDDSLKLLEEISQSDYRIKIINQKNGGLSNARNTGIRNATGDLLVFLDSDDCLLSGALRLIAEGVTQTQADIFVYGAECDPPQEDNFYLNDVLTQTQREYLGFSGELFYGKNAVPFTWCKAMRRSYVLKNDLFFDESIRYGEDMVHTLCAYAQAQKISFSPLKLYKYTVSRAGSLMDAAGQKVEKKLMSHVEIASAVAAYFAKHNLLEKYRTEYIDWLSVFIMLDMLRLHGSSFKSVKAALKDLLNEYFDSFDFAAPYLCELMQNVIFQDSILQPLLKIKYSIGLYSRIYGRENLVKDFKQRKLSQIKSFVRR